MVSRASPKKQHEIPKVKLTCEFPIEVDYQRIVFPVKSGEQMKEAKEPHLRRAVKRCGVTVCIYTPYNDDNMSQRDKLPWWSEGSRMYEE